MARGLRYEIGKQVEHNRNPEDTRRLKMKERMREKRDYRDTGTQKSVWENVQDKLGPAAAPFLIAAVVNVLFLAMLFLTQGAVAKARMAEPAASGVDAVLYAVDRTPSHAYDVKLAVADKDGLVKGCSLRWYLNGHHVKGYTKKTFPGMGLKKGDSVRVEVVDGSGKVVTEKCMEVVNPPLPLSG